MEGTLAGHLSPRQTPAPTSSSGSSTDQLLKLLADPFQAALQTNAVWASVGIYLPLTIFLALVFSLIRPRHRLVYAPKSKVADEKHAPPPMGSGLLSWIGPVSKAKEDFLMERIGMDAVVFLRFTRMLRNIFVILGLIGLVIMIPVNVTQGAPYLKQGGSGFAIMTPLFIFGGGLWAQVVVAWATNIIVGYFLWVNYRRVHQLRRNYFESHDYQASLHARTVLMWDIPEGTRMALCESQMKSTPQESCPRSL
jgi:calcium permeable stress-gated cation channel